LGDCVLILPVFGITTHIPSRYVDIVERLRALGLAPTGDPQIDKMRLKNALEKRAEKIQEQQKMLEEQEKSPAEKRMMEERLGAQALAEQNKFFFNL
jgi:hypothetical protein